MVCGVVFVLRNYAELVNNWLIAEGFLIDEVISAIHGRVSYEVRTSISERPIFLIGQERNLVCAAVYVLFLRCGQKESPARICAPGFKKCQSAGV